MATHIGAPRTITELTGEDLEALRLLLRGRSVIDWHRLQFDGHAEVHRFLRVNEFDPESPQDMARLEQLRRQAYDYVIETFAIAVPPEVASEVPAADLLLMASRNGPHQRMACLFLKVMHIIHHIAGRERLLSLSISDDAVFQAIELKVMRVVEELRAAGHPVSEFQWSRKQRHSLITKLLAKPTTQAAQIYDRLRFRLIVPRHDDLLPILAAITNKIVPFNYVVPGATVNHLVPFEETVESYTAIRGFRTTTEMEAVPGPSDEDLRAPVNEFSHEGYKIINFVADLPLRVSDIAPDEDVSPELGHVVFVLTEFQLADEVTAENNEHGDSNHDAYKSRQVEKVRARLWEIEEP